jgi:hypothetical protein
VTAVFAVPLTVAVNCWVCVTATTAAIFGVTVTLTAGDVEESFAADAAETAVARIATKER